MYIALDSGHCGTQSLGLHFELSSNLPAWVCTTPISQVPENFFIEGTTGNCVEVDEYLGIECLWDNSNYWVNMQDCSHGIGVSTHSISSKYMDHKFGRDSFNIYISKFDVAFTGRRSALYQIHDF